MSAKYRAAVVGCGRIARTHALTYRRHPDIDLVAGVDVEPGTLSAFQDDFGVTATFSDYREMLGHSRPDIVSICTFVGLHWPIFEACVEAGVRGIICEKPMFSTPSELAQARALVFKTGVKVVSGHMRRYGAAHLRARELFLNGTVGDPVFVTGALQGGDMAEMGAHWIDLIRFFNDDATVAWVLAQTSMHDKRGWGHAVEDHALLYMQFENGVKAIYEGGQTVLNGEIYTLLQGSAGSIQIVREDELIVSGREGVRHESFGNEPPETWKTYGLEPPDPAWNYKWDMLLREYLAWLEGGDEPGAGFTNASAATEIYLAAYLSAIRREKIELPLLGVDVEHDEWPGEELARRAIDRS